MIRFPPGFLFGTATAATQVEGHCPHTDWSDFAKVPGRVRGGDTPDVACDQFHRFRDDVELQRRLGFGAHRMGLEWARIEPREGEIDLGALEHYRQVVGALVDAHIVPMVTLHHFTIPRWVRDRGGLLWKDLPEVMARFTRTAVGALSDLCKRFITINEPNVLAAQSYLTGQWPPGHTSMPEAMRAHQNLLRAHRAMYRAAHAEATKRRHTIEVGVAHHLRVVTPLRDRAIDRAAAFLFRRAFNHAFAGAVCRDRTQDFFGLNYYGRDLVRFSLAHANEGFLPRSVPEGAETSDLGWEIYPEGLGQILDAWGPRAGVPIYITENGIADAGDVRRASFLVRHLIEVSRAIERGIDVRGYFHWSLLDNFEWAEGYAPRFGLVHVDYATQTRTVRESGKLYGEIAREGAITQPLLERSRAVAR